MHDEVVEEADPEREEQEPRQKRLRHRGTAPGCGCRSSAMSDAISPMTKSVRVKLLSRKVMTCLMIAPPSSHPVCAVDYGQACHNVKTSLSFRAAAEPGMTLVQALRPTAARRRSCRDRRGRAAGRRRHGQAQGHGLAARAGERAVGGRAHDRRAEAVGDDQAAIVGQDIHGHLVPARRNRTGRRNPRNRAISGRPGNRPRST